MQVVIAWLNYAIIFRKRELSQRKHDGLMVTRTFNGCICPTQSKVPQSNIYAQKRTGRQPGDGEVKENVREKKNREKKKGAKLRDNVKRNGAMPV